MWIYKIIDRYVCIDYLGTDINRINELILGCTLKTKHEGMDYDNLFGIGIPDILLNMLSCHGFLNNNESIVILKCPNNMSEYYFNKGFIKLNCDEDHLNKLPKLVQQRVGAEPKVNSDLVMLCKTTIISTSNTLKNLYISSDYHEDGLIQVHGTTKIFDLNYMELLLKILLNRLEQTDTISCVL